MRAAAHARRLIRIVVGFTLLIVGIAALVLPGPGWLTIALALTILATEFVWAKRLLDHLKAGAGKIGRAVRKTKGEGGRG